MDVAAKPHSLYSDQQLPSVISNFATITALHPTKPFSAPLQIKRPMAPEGFATSVGKALAQLADNLGLASYFSLAQGS
ncbi:hypothetical protein GGP41_009649 [Bipolaris sorokiniana]|uniref:Uncharacterized protein n=1 Tax=Cochliobolus sativus TaxID=45130 RepID=A0A8H5ZAJ2_COCSA|nr:hypothetical protein GGP41_009649 [Bipolaris sorokiniana]